MAKVDDLDKYFDDITKPYKEAAKYLAENTGTKIEAAYQEVISEFYKDYDPTLYSRKEWLRYASSAYSPSGRKPKNPFRGTRSPYIYYAGITLDPGRIPGTYLRDKRYPHITNEWIYFRAFSKGIHGFSAEDVEIHNRAAELSHQSFKKKNKLSKYYEAMGVWHPGTIPPVMSPTPEELMDSKFDKITNHKTMTMIYTKRLNRLKNGLVN